MQLPKNTFGIGDCVGNQGDTSSSNRVLGLCRYLFGLRRRLDYGPRRQKYHENARNNQLKTVNIRLSGKSRLKKASVVEQGPGGVLVAGGLTPARTRANVKAPAFKSTQRDLPAEIYLTRDGQQYGPYSPEQLKVSLSEGTVNPSDLAWHEGMTDWVPLSTIVQ